MSKQPTYRVIGIDPGMGRMGWAIVEGNRSKQTLIACGCEETKAGIQQARRLQMIFEKLVKLVEEYQPTVAGVEELYFFKNAKTVIRVGEARGVALVALKQAGLEVYDYTPLQVKQTVTGYGKADKKQVQIMVKSILKMPEMIKPDDAADAVAVALTHFFTNREMKG